MHEWYLGCGKQIAPKDAAKYSGLSWIAQPKCDGIWACVKQEAPGEPPVVYSRTGKIKDYTLPKLPMGTILIGELGYGSQYAAELAEHCGPFVWMFDMVQHPKFGSIHNEDLLDRLILLRQFHTEYLGREYVPVDVLVAPTTEVIQEFHEGVVFKSVLNAKYPYGGMKTPWWVKCKKTYTVDAICMGYEISDAERHTGAVKALEFGVYKDGELVKITQVGALTDDIRYDAIQHWERYEGRPAEIECYSVFKSGSLRHPSFVRWRDDKPEAECTWEALMS